MALLKNRALKIVACVLALLSPFLFPYSITMVLAIIAGLYIPIVPFFVGLLTDLLYYPGHHAPMATLYGAGITAAILLVRYIIRTRIM